MTVEQAITTKPVEAESRSEGVEKPLGDQVHQMLGSPREISGSKGSGVETQGQLDFGQEKFRTGFVARDDGSYSIKGPDNQDYTVRFFDENKKQVNPSHDSIALSDLGVSPEVSGKDGKLVGRFADSIAGSVSSMISQQHYSDLLAQLKLNGVQKNALGTILAAMTKSPPDLDSMNKAADQLSEDPQKFKEVFSGMFYDSVLSARRNSDIVFDATKSGGKIHFLLESNRSALIVSVPSEIYKNGKW